MENIKFIYGNHKKSLFWPRKKPLREWGHSRTVFLMHRDPSEALFWSQNSLVGWSSDSESRGTGFDSRLGRVMFGSLVGHVGVTVFFAFSGTCWEMFGDTLGMFLDGFGRVSRKSSEEVENSKLSEVSGSIFPASGRSKQ